MKWSHSKKPQWILPLVFFVSFQATVKAEAVFVCQEAWYMIPASRGSVCAGNRAQPLGVACPLTGDSATNGCHSGLPSFTNSNCVAKENAECVRGGDGSWRCVFPSIGCRTARKLGTVECPVWDWNDSMDDVVVFDALGNVDIEMELQVTVSESWFEKAGPVSDLVGCTQPSTPPPTTSEPVGTVKPPLLDETPAPTQPTPSPQMTIPPTTIPPTTWPPTTSPLPTTWPPTTAPPTTWPPTTSPPPTTWPPTKEPPPTTWPPTTAPPTTWPPTTSPPPTTWPPTTAPPTTWPPPKVPPPTEPPTSAPPTTQPPTTQPPTTQPPTTQPPTTAPPTTDPPIP